MRSVFSSDCFVTYRVNCFVLPQLETGQPETPAQPKPQDKTTQPDKAQPAKDGTPEQQQETLAAKAAELDRSDAAFSTGDVAGMAETFEQMFGENPAGLTDALWMAYRFLEQRSPEQFSQLSKMIVADQLAQVGMKWETLEKIAGYLKQANDRETFDDLNKLAVFLKQIGHGPSTTESQSASFTGYSKQIGGMLERNVPALIRSAFGERFSSVAPYDQTELMTAAHLEIRDLLLKDSKLASALSNLSKRYSDKEGVRIYLEMLAPKLRTIIPLVARKLENENRDLFKALPAKPQAPKPAAKPVAAPAATTPRSMAEYYSRGMTLADILKETEGEIASGSFLTQEDADSMGDMEILSSRRVPLTKKPWRPGNELDQL